MRRIGSKVLGLLLPFAMLLPRVSAGAVEVSALKRPSTVIAYPKLDTRSQILMDWLNGRGHSDPKKAWEMQRFAQDELLALGRIMVGPLVHRMASGDVMTRIQSIRLLARLGEKSLGEAFLRHLSIATNPYERLALIQSLGQLRHRPARREVLAFLASAKDSTARAVAIDVLGHVGKEEDAERLMPLLEDDGLVLVVLRSLEALKATKSLPALFALVASDRPLRVRQAALAAVARMDGKASLPLLARLWTNGQFPTAVILDSLGATKTLGALPFLLGALRGQLPPARKAMGESLPDVAKAAAAAMGRCGQREAVLSLSAWLRFQQGKEERMLGMASLYRLTKDESYLETLDGLAASELTARAHQYLLRDVAGLSNLDARLRSRQVHASCSEGAPCAHEAGGHMESSWIEKFLDACIRRKEAQR